MNLHPSAPHAPRGPCLRSTCVRFAALASFTLTVAAQPALQPVVVTASREAQPLDRVSADVVLIDAETIRSSTADSVEDLLRREAGVQVSRNGGPGQNAGIQIRGASAAQALVLIDGVRVGSATLGQVEMESIDLAQIDHIEVLRGPGSSLYGADAVGGVVQIFTRRGTGDPRVTAQAALGGYGAHRAALGVGGSGAGIDYAASLMHEGDRGVSAVKPGDAFGTFNPDADGYQRRTADLQLGYTPVAGHRVGLNLADSRLASRYDSAVYLPPDFTPDPSPDFRNRLATRIASLDYRGVIDARWTTSARWARSVDDLQSGADLEGRFTTRRNQFTWQNALDVAAGQQVVLAYEHLVEQVAGSTFASDESRSNQALVAGYSGRFDDQTIQADIRRDQNSVYGGVTTGRLGWSLGIAPGWRVRALAGTTFRAPSFNDLFFPGYGVPSIAPEHGRSIEVGLNWHDADGEVAATLYRNQVRELIQYESDPTHCPTLPDYANGCAGNIGRARLQGATLSGARRWGGLRLSAILDLLDAKDTDTGERLQRRAAHQETLAADYGRGAWSAGASVLGVGSRPDGGVKLGAYATLDLRARWKFARRWQLEAKLLNATDKVYEPARDYQPLGRQAWIGLRYDSQGL